MTSSTEKPNDRRTDWLNVLLVVILTVSLSAVGAAIAGWIAWRGAPPLPDNQGVTAIATRAVTGHTASIVRHDDLFDYFPPSSDVIDAYATDVLGADGYGPGRVQITIDHVTDPPGALTGARSRLAADGWRVTAVQSDPYSSSFRATRGALSVSTTIANSVGEQGVQQNSFDPTVQLSIWRTQPERVPLAVGLGSLAGLLVGGIGVVAIRRALRNCDARQVRRVQVYWWSTVLLALLATMFTILAIGGVFTDSAMRPEDAPPPWAAYMLFPARPLMAAACVTTLLAAIGTLRRRRS